MNSMKFKELAKCALCCELFDEHTRCPRILTCGHTICLTCLEKDLLELGDPSCPSCKENINFHDADLIPVNYILKSMISVNNQGCQSEAEMNSSPLEASGLVPPKLESQGMCTEHSNLKQLRCMDCESWICGFCSKVIHKKKEVYSEFKVLQLAQKVDKELGARTMKIIKEKIRNLNKEMKRKENDLQQCKMKVDEINTLKTENIACCENLKQLQTAIKNLTNVQEISEAIRQFENLLDQGKNFLCLLEKLEIGCPLPDTIEELRKLCEKESVGLAEKGPKTLYGTVKCRNGQIRICCFQLVRPHGRLFSCDDFLCRFNGSSKRPNKVYLQLEAIGGADEAIEVVIETIGKSKTIRRFIFALSNLPFAEGRNSCLGIPSSCI